MVDIKEPTKPYLASVFPTPVPPKGVPYSDFCDKGGRFGPHNTNLEYHLPDVEKQADLIYLTYFNAGLRIYDIKNPRLPKEVGWFIPPTTTKRQGTLPYDKLVSQTEDGSLPAATFITDKNWGSSFFAIPAPASAASNGRMFAKRYLPRRVLQRREENHPMTKIHTMKFMRGGWTLRRFLSGSGRRFMVQKWDKILDASRPPFYRWFTGEW
jgi:hypothetical protein